MPVRVRKTLTQSLRRKGSFAQEWSGFWREEQIGGVNVRWRTEEMSLSVYSLRMQHCAA